MIRILSIIMLSLALCSCEPTNVKDGRDLYMLYLKKTAKDPLSIKVYSEKFEIRDPKVYWTLDVGGANSYGGMVRKTIKLETTGRVLLKTEDGKLVNRKDLQ